MMAGESREDDTVLNAIFNPLMPVGTDEPQLDNVEIIDENDEISQRARDLELKGVRSAEAGDLNTAVSLFDQAVHVAPERASCYNNRAQVLRLKGDVLGALADLNRAVELSNGQGRAACQALTQRALINRLEGHNERAFKDFKLAASLGSAFAKAQLVKMNPYSAMCNQMLSEAVAKLRAGECDD